MLIPVLPLIKQLVNIFRQIIRIIVIQSIQYIYKIRFQQQQHCYGAKTFLGESVQ